MQKLGAESRVFSVQAISCVLLLRGIPLKALGGLRNVVLFLLYFVRGDTLNGECGLCHADIGPSAFPFCSHMEKDGHIFIWKAIINLMSAMPNMVTI